ncbi:hypothetical protein GQX74_012378 [Glossina fuscipes]|nr:hypothetical protein GQX74_012378 [Glossina fuscipes]
MFASIAAWSDVGIMSLQNSTSREILAKSFHRVPQTDPIRSSFYRNTYCFLRVLAPRRHLTYPIISLITSSTTQPETNEVVVAMAEKLPGQIVVYKQCIHDRAFEECRRLEPLNLKPRKRSPNIHIGNEQLAIAGACTNHGKILNQFTTNGTCSNDEVSLNALNATCNVPGCSILTKSEIKNSGSFSATSSDLKLIVLDIFT